MSRQHRSCRPDAGFTVIELMVSVSILAVIGAATMSLIVQSLQVSAATGLRVQVLTDMERSHERISRTIRGADPITTATPTQLQLTVYDNADQRRILTYTFASGALTQREVTYPSAAASASSDQTSPMMDGLMLGGADLFTYRDSTGGVWDGVSVGDIAQVEVFLAATADGNVIQLSSSAQVRNHDG